ncbi:expressed unknown protein [Seminavis robusta]|uniref:Uncharacterized protein n=1 Tax=Seminavis robusta TaxID=568900 RepID=A0A9N8DKH0_9STRA|nr:expressed unknown protein [Seminavis robusta]|eukprot:Sro171_g075680.1 n/a (350) ;mRNA; f:16301-17350
MDWFEQVFGFREEGGFEEVKSKFAISREDDGNILLSTAAPGTKRKPKRTFHVGRFDTPTLSELRDKAGRSSCPADNKRKRKDGLTFQHIIGDVDALHRAQENQGAVFQAASQFNCLEMIHPSITREMGITRYAHDYTQGPACAMVCPAGTLYRNYFAEPMNTLQDVGKVLGNHDISKKKPMYWKIKNGYALAAKKDSIKTLSQKLQENDGLIDKAMAQLRVGVHWNTEVDQGTHNNSDNNQQRVAQVYCSALPIAYDITASDADWSHFAQLVLDGSYEATLAVAAVLAKERNKRVKVYLTMLGGGAFGNRVEWIRQAIQRALRLYQDSMLDVYLVHYKKLSPDYSDLTV